MCVLVSVPSQRFIPHLKLLKTALRAPWNVLGGGRALFFDVRIFSPAAKGPLNLDAVIAVGWMVDGEAVEVVTLK